MIMEELDEANLEDPILLAGSSRSSNRPTERSPMLLAVSSKPLPPAGPRARDPDHLRDLQRPVDVPGLLACSVWLRYRTPRRWYHGRKRWCVTHCLPALTTISPTQSLHVCLGFAGSAKSSRHSLVLATSLTAGNGHAGLTLQRC